jgi:hypothetical protein
VILDTTVRNLVDKTSVGRVARSAAALVAVALVAGCGGDDVRSFDEGRLRATIRVMNADADPDAVDVLVESVRSTCEGADDASFAVTWGMSDANVRSFIRAGCEGRVSSLGLD